MTPARGFASLGLLFLLLIGLAVFGGAGYYGAHSGIFSSSSNTPVVSSTAAQPMSHVSTSAASVPPPSTAVEFATWLPIGTSKDWYHISSTGVVCLNTVVPNADLASFQVDSNGVYAKDRRQVYRCSGVVAGADPQTFSPYTGSNIAREYARDTKRVYYSGRVIQGVDPATFHFGISSNGLTWYEYALDATRVYYMTQLIAGADPLTFKPIDSVFALDKNAVYSLKEGEAALVPVPGADPTTIVFDASGVFAKDKGHVYALNGGEITVVPGADPETFALVGRVGEGATEFYYLKDSKHVYYYDLSYYKSPPANEGVVTAINAADPVSFALRGLIEGQNHDASDKNHHYFAGEIVE